MNDLDNEIRRAFDELVNAAPPPPNAPSPVVQFSEDRNPWSSRLLAVAASILLIAALGIVAYSQRSGRTDTVATSAGTAPSDAVTTPPPVPTPVQAEPPLIRVDGGSPDPVTSVELADVEEYEVVTPSPFPGTTDPVPLQGEAYDGVYFAYLHEGPGPDDPRSLRFDVLQAFSGQDCLDRFGSDASGVCTPFGIDVNGATGRLDLAVDGTVITVRDVNSSSQYRISGDELLAVINGGPPAPSAPGGYGFSGGFGFLLTFDNGTPTRIDQPSDPQSGATASGWSPATEPFLDVTYIACCGTDWSGLPSPAVPADPSDQLAPGIYNIRQIEDDEPFDGLLSLELRAYERCNDLGDRGNCLSEAPDADDDLGVANQPDRVIDLAFETFDVSVSSRVCTPDELVEDRQLGRGTDLAALYSELEVDYRDTVLEPFDAGISPEEIRASVTATAGPGFFNPGCPSWSTFWWAPAVGPTVIVPYLAHVESPVDWKSIPIWTHIIPTALAIDEQGAMTLYLTTGFLS